jgi:MFS family permease
LVNTLAPLIMAEMHLNQTGFGWLISAFSIAYAASSLAVGWFLDRAGVNRGATCAVAWWSLAALSAGLVRSVPGLLACRAALGIGESAGVPAVAKANAMYLKPAERALGTALNQVGLSVGLVIAPIWIGVAHAHSWRTTSSSPACLDLFGSRSGSSPPARSPQRSPASPPPASTPAGPSFATAHSSWSSSRTAFGCALIRSGRTGPPCT